ncbi:MAG: hypothetical protein GTO41_25675 [Burkholderiales bacterium]|nr:hypothetical protein [Burkholderiales bacterium]
MVAITKTTLSLGTALIAATVLIACGDSGSPADNATAKSAAESTASAGKTNDAMPAGGYAPKLTMPKKRPDHVEVPLAEMFLNSAQVPAAENVNIPVYPGVKIVSTMAGGQFDSSSGAGVQLPGMVLLSSDELGSILAFYQDKLAGWQHEEFYGIHTFWDGPEGSNAMDITAGYSMLTLGEIEEDDVLRLLWPEMRTKIDMMYDKPGN